MAQIYNRVYAPYLLSDEKRSISVNVTDNHSVSIHQSTLLRGTNKHSGKTWAEPEKVEISSVVGVDAGIGDTFATLSSGEKVDNPRFYRSSHKRMKFLSKALNRKQKGSHRRDKARVKKQKLHLKISNQRADFLHKFTTDLVKSHDEIVIEDLDLQAMKSALKLGKSVSDVARGEARRQLEYKCS